MSDSVPRPSLQATVEEEDKADIRLSPEPTSVPQLPQLPEPTDAEIEALMDEEANSKPKRKNQAPLDLSSEEAFPSLMPSAAPSAPSGSWSNRPKPITPALIDKSKTAAAAAAAARSSLGGINLPGKFTDRVELKSSQLTPTSKLNKPVQAILADIKKRTGAHVTVRSGPLATVTFEAQGMKKAVQQALWELVELVGLKQSVRHPIPSSVRPFIIGKQGSTIMGIIERTKAKIQMPRQDGQNPVDDEDEVLVTIEGNPLSVMLAQKEIDDIVNEKTSTLNVNLRDISPDLYPFLAGANEVELRALESNGGINIRVPTYQTWSDQPPTRPEDQGLPVTFHTRSDLPIQISGDRAAVQAARRVLEQRAEALKAKLRVDQLPIERGRHQFIVGPRGVSINDFLAETGCSVILPPPESDSEILTIVGPFSCIEAGISKVEDLASRMVMSTVDVARQHNSSHSHAHNLTRYFQCRNAVSNLEKQHNASIVLPVRSDGPCAWELFSSDGKSLYRARSDVMNLVNAHPPSRVGQVDVNPFFHPFLREKHASKLRTDYGAHLVFPTDSSVSSSNLLLVIESPCPENEYQFPTQVPTASDVLAFQKSLAQATEYLNSITNRYPTITTRELEADVKFHDKIRRFVSEHYQQAPEDQIIPQLLFAGDKSKSTKFGLRGAEDMVDAVVPEILKFLQQEKEDELERSYTTSFEFPQKFANFLIGKGGENIRKLREEFDVEIKVNDGKVDLQGPQAKAARAKTHILALGKKWADETTVVVKIDPQYHSELIGPGGNQVIRLQDRYNVRVNFPRSVSDNTDAPTENESRGRSQAPDEIIIKGPSQGVSSARSDLQDLFKYIAENSNTTTVSVDRSLVPMLIGQAGRELERLRLTTGAKVEIPVKNDTSSERVEIKLKGTKQQISDAKKIIDQRSAEFDATVTKTIEVDRKYHKNLIGSEGSNIRQILIAAGFTSDDPRERARVVRFPNVDSTENVITVQGAETIVDAIIQAIESQVSLREGQITDTVDVPASNHRSLIGQNGDVRRQLETDFKVQVDIPRRGATGPTATHVKVTGLPEDVERCKVKINELVKQRSEEIVDVPRGLHHHVAENGQFFRRLRRELNVVVDHNGHELPPKPAASGPPTFSADDISDPVLHIATPVISSGGDATLTIPWVLRGAPEKLSQARALIESAMGSTTEDSKCTGYLFLPDPSVYGKIVGPGGSQVSSIRRETGAQITVPRSQVVGVPIEIVGSRSAIEHAKSLILDTIESSS